jgi:hypothetical protein
MHRRAAATLTAVLALSVLLPYVSLLSDSESNLPACCRRNGAHHCAMMMEMARNFASQGPAFRTAACPCPFQKALTPIGRGAPYPAVLATVYAAILSHPAVHLQTIVSGLVSKSRSHQKRGPPSFVNC